jgi:uncharacterized protein with PIN domain
MVYVQKEAHFRFYEELNDFLPKKERKRDIHYNFTGNPSVKDAIEALGVPHTEIDLILVNGVSVKFDYRLQHGNRISVYPVFESMDIAPVLRLRPKPLRITCFICDVHLGKLARQLRMLGFDVMYDHTYCDSELIDKALEDRRIILTRDQGILKQKRVTHGYWVRSVEVNEQLVEAVRKFDLCKQVNPFTRCMMCNGLIEKIEKNYIRERIEQNTALYYNEFYRCPRCKKIYWKGSHYKRMEKRINKICDNIKIDA